NNPGDMLEQFDLTVNAAYMTNGDPNLTFHYFATMTDAENNVNEILTPTAAIVGSNVWIRVENNRVDFNGNHCYVLVEQPLTVNPVPNPIIVSDNGLNTVYVDNSNNVVQPLLLNSSVTGNFIYQWYENGVIISGATSSTYLIQTASIGNVGRLYTVYVKNLDTGCEVLSTSFLVSQSNGVPPPSGVTSQTLSPGSTLGDIVISGTNVQWYASTSGKNSFSTFSTPLPLNTLLVDGTTYYASQTIDGIESAERLPVTVHLTLGVDDNEIVSLRFAPNPVKNDLMLQSVQVLKSVAVYNLLGQKVFEQNCNNTEISIDLSKLATGNYILKAQDETGQKTIRIVKE
ncbi:MAG TPA: T9SS type A sorting domain-containing protein, partial [Flavobacterium sp.]|uniref:T9SS type A sorting domain-containing protein n=1 Tax=Flavobacterium sp. TaxID=239 RepID=UPI002C728F02